MNDNWINLASGMARIVVTQVGASKGVGVCQLNVTVELAPRKDTSEGVQLWLGGTIRIGNFGAHGGYLATLRTDIQPTTLQAPGGHQTVSMTADIDPRQLQTIENVRTAGVTLDFSFSGYSLTKGAVLPYWSINVSYAIDQSSWLRMLEQFGYDPVMLVELEALGCVSKKSANEVKALAYLDDARKNYLEGEWRSAVECLRQSLAALVGKEADEEDTDADVTAALSAASKVTRSGNVPYDTRFELTRRALKFTCDIAAHPEVAETTRREAHASLLAVAGLLSRL